MAQIEQPIFSQQKIVGDILSKLNLSDSKVVERVKAILDLPAVSNSGEGRTDSAGFHGTSLYGLVNALNTGYFAPSRLKHNSEFRGFYFAPNLYAQGHIFEKFPRSKGGYGCPRSRLWNSY